MNKKKKLWFSWKDRVIWLGPLHLHSDLSGRCWLGDKYGYMEDMPRRVYTAVGRHKFTFSLEDEERFVEYRHAPLD